MPLELINEPGPHPINRAFDFAMSAHTENRKPEPQDVDNIRDMGDNSVTYLGYDVEYYEPYDKNPLK